jgi:hypothetical protein
MLAIAEGGSVLVGARSSRIGSVLSAETALGVNPMACAAETDTMTDSMRAMRFLERRYMSRSSQACVSVGEMCI